MSGQTITKTLVDGLETKPSEYAVWDGKLPGFGVRVRPTGAKSFVIVYRAGSGRGAPFRRFTIGAVGKIAPEAARTRAKVLLGGVAQGQDPAAEKRVERSEKRPTTFEELAELYVTLYAKTNKSSWKNDEGYLKRPRAKWGKLSASEITDDHIAELLDEIAETAPVSANRTQSVLHTLFRWAKEPGRKYVKFNPVADMKRRSKEKRRERILTDDEVKTLWWGLNDSKLPASKPVVRALKLILTTMVRPGQAAGALREEMVGLLADSPQFHIPRERVKRRREVIIPLSALAVAVVSEALESHNQIAVFPSAGEANEPLTRNSLSAALTGKPATKTQPARIGIREFLKMNHFTPHDLRRTAATIARRAGAKREDVKATLDHLEGDVTAVYDKYDMLAEKREVVRILAKELQSIISGEAGKLDCPPAANVICAEIAA